jgi:carbon-monoxide dehydrogenase small subunit
MSEQIHEVRLHVNGVAHDIAVPARRLLSDALRHDIGLTGTHVGCEHGVCGACSVLVDGRPMRSCLMFAVSAVDCEITTVEGLTHDDGSPGVGWVPCSRPSWSATGCSAGSARPAS